MILFPTLCRRTSGIPTPCKGTLTFCVPGPRKAQGYFCTNAVFHELHDLDMNRNKRTTDASTVGKIHEKTRDVRVATSILAVVFRRPEQIDFYRPSRITSEPMGQPFSYAKGKRRKDNMLTMRVGLPTRESVNEKIYDCSW